MQSNEHTQNTVKSNSVSKHGHATKPTRDTTELQWEKDLLKVIENTKSPKDVPLTKAQATSICRKKGMGDSKIQELMSKLKGGGTVSLESLEGLLGEFSQPGSREVHSETNSCESTDVGNEETSSSLLENGTATAGQSIPNTNGSSSRGTNFLELANTLHFAAIASIKSESNDLQKRLKKVTTERDLYKQGLRTAKEEKENLIVKYEARLHEQEQQVTELQSVIAELRKKLDQAAINCIAEEDEEEEGTPSSDERGNSSNASQGGSEQGDAEDSEVFEMGEQRTTSPAHVNEVNYNTLSKTNEKLHSLGQTVTKSKSQNQEGDDAKQLQLSRSIFMQLQKKLTELKDQCQELEKKKHQIEKQIQQASVVEYVNRKRSSDGNELQHQVSTLTRERDFMKSKVTNLEQEVEKIRKLSHSLQEERDILRKKYQDTSKSSRTLESPRASRVEISDGSEPPSPRISRSHSQTHSAFTPVQATYVNSSQFSPRLGRPRVSSTPISPLPRQRSFNKIWSLGDSPSSSLKSLKNSPPGSVKSAQGALNNVSSDLGSSVVSCPDAVLMSQQKKDSKSECENELIEGLTGDKLIKILHQLPDFDKMPESLVNTLHSCQTLRDVFHALRAHWTQQSEGKIHEYQIEVERMRTKLEHIRAQNNVVALSMEESKSNSEQLSLLIGKYESQCTALQVELDICDRIIDGYEALVCLYESEQDVLSTNCNADGIDLFRYRTLSRGGSEGRLRCGDMYDDDEDRVATGTYERRRKAEAQARALLQKYDRGSDGNVSTSGNRPWEELSSVSRTSATSSTGSSAELDFNKEEEGRLRGYLSRLHDERETVKTTLMEIQSVHDVYVPVARLELDSLDPKLDLENAVLVQELMALKEEKAELRAKVYLTEKEKKALELQLSSRAAQEQAYVVHIEHLKSEVKDQIRKRRKLEETARAIQGSKASDTEVTSSSGSSVTPAITLAELRTSDEDIPADLYEAARREKKLKSRIRELVDALENLSKNSETQNQQAGEYIADLKRANGALVAAYEKAKRKHTTRVKKLESQMMAMMEKHEKQISSLRERIVMQDETEPTHPNETAL